MSRDDALRQLRDVNPVSQDDFSRVEAGALDALREGITMTDPTLTASAPRQRRFGPRSLAAGVLSLTLIGGGAAYAGYQQWYAGGATDGLTCFTRWADQANQVGGPELTGDPVEDCQRYQQLTGRPAIEDPVAFRRDGMLFVGPRAQVPEGSRILAGATPDDAATRELKASLEDWVDGALSSCLTPDQAVAFAKAEVKRLGLPGWTVSVEPPAASGYPCAALWMDDERPQTVSVRPEAIEDPGAVKPETSVNPAVYALRDTLRSQVADGCVSLKEATAIATRALGSQHHWPLTAIRDARASCTRVDLEVGGSIQVTLRGPATAKP